MSEHASRDALWVEVQFFHTSFFGAAPTESFCERYVAAHQSLDGFTQAPEQEAAIATIVQKRLNPLCLEAALRGGAGMHLLSRKLLLIAFLAETDGNHLDNFAPVVSPGGFWLRLPWRGMGAVWRRVWGHVLVRKYELV